MPKQRIEPSPTVPTIQAPAPAPAEPDIEGLFFDQPYIGLPTIEFLLNIPGTVILAAHHAGLVRCRSAHVHPDLAEIERGSLLAWLRATNTPFVFCPAAATIAACRREIAAERARHEETLRSLESQVSAANWKIAEQRDAEAKAARARRKAEAQG